MAFEKIKYVRGGWGVKAALIRKLIAAVNAQGNLTVKAGDKIGVDQSGTNTIITVTDSSEVVGALESSVATLQTDLEAAKVTIAAQQEQLDDQAGAVDGSIFTHTLNFTGDVRITAGSNDNLWRLSFSYTFRAEWAGGYNFASTKTLNYRNWSHITNYGGSASFPPTGYFINLPVTITGPGGTSTFGGGNSVSSILTANAQEGSIKMAISAAGNNSGNETATDTGAFEIGRLIRTSAGATFLFTGSGGSTSRDDTDGA